MTPDAGTGWTSGGGPDPCAALRIVQVVQEISHSGGCEAVALHLQRCWEDAGVRSDVLSATVGEGVRPGEAARIRHALPPALARRIPTRGRWRHLGRMALVPAFTLAAAASLRSGRRPGGWADGAVVVSHGDSLVADVVVLHAVNAASLAQKRADGEWRWMLNPLHLWVAARDRLMLGGLRARRYVVLSSRGIDELATHHGVPRDRVAVIPNGVDLDRFSPDGPGAGLRDQFAIPANAPLLLFVGHEFDRKGLAHAIGALAEPGCADAHLVAVGAGDAAAYGALAAERGVAGRVHFAGPRSDLPAVYRDADAFVFPTSYETFSLVCMEAMACGVPVFAAPVGGIEDYLRDGENGHAIARDAGSIAATLGPLLRDRAALARLGAGARRTALGFGWPEVAARYLRLLDEVRMEKDAAAARLIGGDRSRLSARHPIARDA